MYKRIVTLFLVFSIIIFSFPFGVKAADLVPAETYYYTSTWSDIVNSVWAIFKEVDDYVGEIKKWFDSVGAFEAFARMSGMYCPAAVESGDDYAYAHFFDGGITADTIFCKYCGISVAEFNESRSSYEDYVSNLDSTIADYYLGWDGYIGESVLYNTFSHSQSGIFSNQFPFFYFLRQCGVANKAMIIACHNQYLVGLYFNDEGKLCKSYFENPYGIVHASYLTMYNLSDLVRIPDSTIEYRIFYSQEAAFDYSDFLTTACYYIDWEKTGYYLSNGSRQITIFSYYKPATDSFFHDDVTEYTINFTTTTVSSADPYWSGFIYMYSLDTFALGSAYVLSQPSGTDETSRVSSLIQALADYNYANNFQNGSSVNYYLCSCDDKDHENLYSPALYDEKSLVFTEPVTGAQYQSNGWTYDYTTRSYDIDLEPGTFTIDGSDITGILCTYGDDAVTIVYSDASGAEVQTDEYNYVMVASSSCALYGHSYTVDTIKEPSCTNSGERVYTCSVCGDQRVEDVPANAHSSVYSVFKEATCTGSGVAMYTCSVCGTQYTETIEALGHDWLSTDHMDAVYALPADTACPGCGGLEFACDLDKDNGVYSCSCVACGASWTVSAEVTTGYTAFKCSRCGVTKTDYEGDEGDGLFQSVGNFIADGINWCTEKLAQLVDNLNTITDQFNAYLDDLAEKGGVFPEFFGALLALIPEDLTALLWFSLVAMVLLFVYKKWLE